MTWLGALQAVATVVRDVFNWKTGGRSHDENALRDEIRHWQEEYYAAFRSGDMEHANHSLSELRRLRAKARSQAD